MKRFFGVMVSCTVAALLFFTVGDGVAQESCENAVYTPIDISPFSGDVISVYKIDDNSFYVLLSGAPPTSPLNKGLPSLLQLLLYSSGSWFPVATGPYPLNSIGGGGCSTAFAVGDAGYVYRIQGTSVTQLKEEDSTLDLRDVCLVDSTILAVGQQRPQMGIPKGVIFRGSSAQPNQ